MDEEPGVFYRVCPRCARAVPTSSSERYCTNDGEPMLERCPGCGAKITSPYARFCGACGQELVPRKPTVEPDGVSSGPGVGEKTLKR